MSAASAATDLLRQLHDNPLIAILRGSSSEALESTVDTLVDAGIASLEITLPTPGALRAIEAARARHPHVHFGAGTVTTAKDVRSARDAGAMFLVSPTTDEGVISTAAATGLPMLPGAFSPSEILSAWRFGATAVKLFPARSLGPSFVADLRAPLPEVPLIAVGGVGVADVLPYLDAGALAVGAGSPLLGDALDGGSQTELRLRAVRFIEVATGSRRDPGRAR